LEDAELLRNCLKQPANGFNKEKLKQYNKYDDKRDKYNRLKSAINHIDSADLEKYIEMAKANTKYPDFC
jgi:hypothetical protein